MVKDSERAWLLDKKARKLTATAVARNSGLSKYDHREKLWARRMFDPSYTLQSNRHMQRGVVGEPFLLSEFEKAIGAAQGMTSNLMGASWNMKSGATPDHGMVLRGDTSREEIVNGEAKLPVFCASMPPAAYTAQQHQQCGTMGVTRTFLIMADTRGKRVAFESRFNPPFWNWCYLRALSFQSYLTAEVGLDEFTAMRIQPFVEENFKAGFVREGFCAGVERTAELPPRRPKRFRADQSKRGGRLFCTAQRALLPSYLPPPVCGITIPEAFCYTRPTSIGADAVCAGLLEYEL